MSFLAGTGHAFAAVRYVDVTSPNPTPPYTTWATAARVIQDAVDAAAAGDEVVVTNGTYAIGGRPVFGSMTNRVAVTIPLKVRSVNGPLYTIIQGRQVPGTLFGDGAIRCVYLAHGASLSGFTITNGATRDTGDHVLEQSGGGLWCQPGDSASVSNCIIAGNIAPWFGGGVYGGTLVNCLVVGNSATNYGGGACSNFLNNCTISANAAMYGAAGVQGGILKNCIVYFNRGPNHGSSYFFSSCASPAPFGGANIAADPRFADLAAGNLRLTSSSPCINAGNNNYVYYPGADLDGNPRIYNGTVDMGAYEFQGAPGPVAAYIVSDPTNVTVAAGSTARLTVTAGGAPPLGFQWYFYETNLPGTVSNPLVLPDAQPANAGPYFVIVTNLYGAATSSVAILTVTNGPPPPPGTHYVDHGSANPVPPYNTWATAARVIQDAVDVASAGDEVVVASGVYAEGGRAIHGLMTNRVAVDKPLRIRSVNGPGTTIIEGRQVSGTTNGDGAVRCVYLANGSSLTGFTLRNGATRATGDLLTEQSGGGVWCGSTGAVSTAVSIKNCILSGNSAANLGGGAYQGTVGDTVLIGNSAPNGGGAAWATLTNCTVAGNSAYDGGGALQSHLENCNLFTNTASHFGGAVYGGSLLFCNLNGNAAAWLGGGSRYAALTNCVLTGNWVSEAMPTNSGGGASRSTLNNCLVISNSAPMGGGTAEGALIGCTVAANKASTIGGGIAGSTLMNTIVYFNTAPESSNSFLSPPATANYSCTTPLPTSGLGNISSDPLFRDFTHGNLRLQPNSPCVDAGLNSYVGWLYDLDWNYRLFRGTVDMGAYESTNIAVTLPYITQQPASQSVTVGGGVTFSVAAGGGAVLGYQWRHEGEEIPGATETSLNLFAVQFKDAGKYSVIVSNSAGQVTSDDAVLTVNPPIAHYVDLNSPDPTPPYTSWETAARVIQDAVDAAAPLEEVVVTNGVYSSGGRAVDGTMTNRVTLAKPITLRSMNGPEVTVIEGYQVPATTNGDGAIRCVYLTNGASLVGFTLTNGATCTSGDWQNERGGGGVFSDRFLYDYGNVQHGPVVSNCVISGNSAEQRGGGAFGVQLENCLLVGNSAQGGGGAAYSTLNRSRLSGNVAHYGGGANDSTLTNCILTGNSATAYGGACYNGKIISCTLVANSAQGGGGGIGGMATNTTVRNSIVYYNQANNGPNHSLVGSDYRSFMSYSCTTPLPQGVSGNFTNEPFFRDQLGGDFYLQDTSPCINGGDSAVDAGALDFEGSPRVVGGVIDIGAYEFQGVPSPRPTHYVSAENSNPVSPYTSWETAAQTIQEAVDAAAPGDEVVVTNGVYATGGRTAYGYYDWTTNRVVIDKRVTVRSVNGPRSTIIAGSGDLASPAAPRMRCVYLADQATLSGFTITNGVVDASYTSGGGVYCQASGSVVSNCVIINNVTRYAGGGVSGGTVLNCVLTGNFVTNAYAYGAGAYSAVVVNSQITSNTARGTVQAYGGGAYSSTLLNCTVTGNQAVGVTNEAAVSSCRLTNCIVYFNNAGGGFNYAQSASLAYSCSTPLADGPGNISADPLFVDAPGGNLHLSPNSPCINAGSNDAVQGTTDLDGKPRISVGIVDMGAYEMGGTVHYVDVNSPGPQAPYETWETAARVIQDAVDVAVPGDEVVVADGVYATGGRAVYGTMTNRVAVTKPLTLHSVNGPRYTIIQGYQLPGTTNGDGAVRCVYLTNGATLSGFTLTRGATRALDLMSFSETYGGGVWSEDTESRLPLGVVSNCIISGNSAHDGGGGAFNTVLNNCLIITNTVRGQDYGRGGGGAHGGTLYNCTVVGNFPTGVYGWYFGHGGILCTLYNCIVHYNFSGDITGNLSFPNYCSTPIWHSSGTGIITNEPLFVNVATGDFRLQPGSPCINAGTNGFAPPGGDIAGNHRIVGGTVDIGAYEFQGSDPTPFYDWLARYGLPTDGSADEGDLDNDGLNNLQEWQAGTNPTNAASVLRLLTPVLTNSAVAVSWKSVAGIGYFLERKAMTFSTNYFAPVLTNFPGRTGTTTFLDTNAISSPGLFYRVGVRGQ